MPIADSFIIGSNVFPLSLLNLITGSAAPPNFPQNRRLQESVCGDTKEQPEIRNTKAKEGIY
jgi:hypothetical protein